jgi:DNA polymerase-3 subunit delta'
VSWPLVGNARAITIIQKSLASGRTQAYLLTGPQHTGRATAARMLAQALNCTGEDRPCRSCVQCRRIESAMHSDVQPVTVAANEEGAARRDISVEQVREVEKSISLAPYEGRRRIVIVDPAELMNDAAQNAFLKSLEEPPPHVVFILITCDSSRILETVRSRCTPVPFSLVPATEIAAALEERGVEARQAGLLARLASGRPGWALAAAADPDFLEGRGQAMERARTLPAAALKERFDVAQTVAESFRKNRQEALTILDEWVLWWRDVMVLQAGSVASVVNNDRLEELQADASKYSSEAVREFVERLAGTGDLMARNVQAKLAMEALMLHVPSGR